MPEILIVGPGAMGRLHAALLARAGADVALLDHRPDRAARLADDGIVLRTDAGDERVAVPCSARPEDFTPSRFIVLFVKAYATETATRFAFPASDAETVWVTLQNGLGNVEAIHHVAEGVSVIAGVTASGAHLLPDDAVRVVAIQTATFGPLPPATDTSAQSLADAFTPAGLPCEVVSDPWPAIWRKLIVNAAINPIAALTARRNGELLDVPWLRRLSAAVAREVHAVALARGIDLSGTDPVAAVEDVCRATAANRCSMLQDFEAGRPTEIEQLNGAVVALAPPGTPAPLCAALTTLVECAAP